MHVRQMRVGMILAQSVRANNGTMLLSEDQPLTAALLERLNMFAEGVGVEEPILVLVPQTDEDA